MSNSQQRIDETSPGAQFSAGSEVQPPVLESSPSIDERVDAVSPEKAQIKRKSLTVAELAAFAASSNSISAFQQNATRTIRTELNADTVLIIDYVDAFGGKTVRAIAGGDMAVIDSEIWLPDWLSPVDISSPLKLVDVDPAQFSSITAMGVEYEYRSALAVAIPGITGAAGIIVALSERPIDFDDSQVDTVKTIAGLLSLSASRSNAIGVAHRGESQLAASRHITRSINGESLRHGQPKSLLGRISDQLAQFFEFDVIALRVQTDEGFSTQESLGRRESFEKNIPSSNDGTDSGGLDGCVETRASKFGIALTNSSRSSEFSDQRSQDAAWKAVGIESILAIPLVSTPHKIVVLGSARFAAYTPQSVANANRFVPALTAAFASNSAAPVEAVTVHEPVKTAHASEYADSIATATELVSACGVIATQIRKRTYATRVRIGFIDEETGHAELGFDTESSGDPLDFARISPDQIERREEIESDDERPRYSPVRIALRTSDHIVGFVEATCAEPGFNDAAIDQIKEIASACAPVVSTLKQLKQSEEVLNKLDMLRRVSEQIRADRSRDPLHSPRIASLIRNLFNADWIYLGSLDHENDYSTTEITDGLDVPELAPGVRVSRRSLLIPSTLNISTPVAIDLESAAPGQRASGRWMYRAGLRSAVCAPIRVHGVVTTMFMCASRNPMGFGSLEKKLTAAIVSELEISIERAATLELAAANRNGANSQVGFEALDENLQAILSSSSALILGINSDGIVTDASGRGIDSLNLVPERLLGRNFAAYSRKIDGLANVLNHALGGGSGRIEIEIFGTILDVRMEPVTVLTKTGKASKAKPKAGAASVTVVVTDITDKVVAARAESELQKMKLEQSRSTEFIVSLSHEMKAPLTTVVALSDLLGLNDRGNLHPDQIERIQVVQQNADRLASLVEDFLNVSKIKAGTFKSNPTKFQISELAHDLETSFKPIATVQGHKLTITDPDDHQFATADRELLRQAIMNLLSNASKFSPANTNLSLDIWVDEQDLRITVSDEGPGIPHDQRDRVFEPYSQLENMGIPGIGMGLAIVQQIVELHHGKVWVEDGVGGGTAFAIWLPQIVSNS